MEGLRNNLHAVDTRARKRTIESGPSKEGGRVGEVGEEEWTSRRSRQPSCRALTNAAAQQAETLGSSPQQTGMRPVSLGLQRLRMSSVLGGVVDER